MLAKQGIAETDAEAKKTTAKVIRAVGERLENTPALARNSYVARPVSSSISMGERSKTFVRGNCVS